MYNGLIVYLEDWSEFEEALPQELATLGFKGDVLLRNFETLTATVDRDSFEHIGEVNRLDLVKKTGTDRDNSSPFWNAPTFDYDHDASPGKQPSETIYAYRVDLAHQPYLVHFHDGAREFDLTTELYDTSGILAYDASMLNQVSPNEHWFLADPRRALLLVFLIVQPTENLD
ncbi:hypothetical protein ACC718_32730 [Rhizobium ruizarguesonis]